LREFGLWVAGKKGIEHGAWGIEKDIAQWNLKRIARSGGFRSTKLQNRIK